MTGLTNGMGWARAELVWRCVPSRRDSAYKDPTGQGTRPWGGPAAGQCGWGGGALGEGGGAGRARLKVLKPRLFSGLDPDDSVWSWRVAEGHDQDCILDQSLAAERQMGWGGGLQAERPEATRKIQESRAG